MRNESQILLPQKGANGASTISMTSTSTDTVSLGLAAFVNSKSAGGTITVKVSSAGTTLTLKVQGMDANGNWYDVPNGAFTAITAAGVGRLLIHPSLTYSAGVTVAAFLPEVWRLIPSAITGTFVISQIAVTYQ